MRLSLVVVLSAWVLYLPQVHGQSVIPPIEEAPAASLKVTGEYLVWWIREGSVPAILTTSTPASQGLLDKPDTRVVYGNERLETRHNDRFVGVRGTLDWMHASQGVGFEARAFFLEREDNLAVL